ncbi:SID1 transmembrane family member 1 isoform X2 [Hydra vulgaris]|uniref:SID1 transmembrane family member 1 isoform X2 n=1 Tax=Hydra vulgaris TaxID=6087 RepID=A0ABM4CP66_HYDVU
MYLLLLIYFAWKSAAAFSALQNGSSFIIGELDVFYNGTVSNGKEKMYYFELANKVKNGSVVQIFVMGPNSTKDLPLLFVVRQMRGVSSWSVPFTSKSGKSYDNVNHLLCPPLNKNFQNKTLENFYVDISNSNHEDLFYSFKVYTLNYVISSKSGVRSCVANPAQPVVYLYEFANDEERVLVKASSESKICATIAIQDSECPSQIVYSGVYATMTKQAGITVEKQHLPYGKFYIVLMVEDTDEACVVQSGKINPFSSGSIDVDNGDKSFSTKFSSSREKHINISVEVLPKVEEYLIPVIAPTIFFGSFYILSFIFFVALWCLSENGGKSFFMFLLPNKVKGDAMVDTNLQEDEPLRTPYDSRNNTYGERVFQTDSPVNSDGDYDWLDDIDQNKDVYRLKKNLFLSDLSRKSHKKLSKKFNVYYWNLLTVAVFYSLPVIQLVLTYQRVVNASGDQDICYYNFKCARPYHMLSAFNNVYSNIGYMMLGLLFVFFVLRRDRLAKQAYAKDPVNSERYGIPKHFGILYAMGYALFMEGVLSACYHVCPNYSNFQFDTAFMYMIGILGCLRLYQTRHHDIFMNGHFVYAGFAAVILTSVVGVIFRSLMFWILFLISHILACLYVSFRIYYVGRIKTALRMNWIRPGVWFAKPIYMVRFVLLVIFFLINLALSINGALNVPRDFATYLLGIIICNGLLYVIFYIIMKVRNGEKIKVLVIFCVLVSLVLWGISISFFVQGLTDWQLSPAESREGNKECTLLEFYDDHDLWHFLSATAMFFTFMGILTIDDDLDDKERINIPVF